MIGGEHKLIVHCLISQDSLLILNKTRKVLSKTVACTGFCKRVREARPKLLKHSDFLARSLIPFRGGFRVNFYLGIL